MTKKTSKIFYVIISSFLASSLFAMKSVPLSEILVPTGTHANVVSTLTFTKDVNLTRFFIFNYTTTDCTSGPTQVVDANCNNGTCPRPLTAGEYGISGAAVVATTPSNTIRSAYITSVTTTQGGTLSPSTSPGRCFVLNNCTQADKENCTASSPVAYTYTVN